MPKKETTQLQWDNPKRNMTQLRRDEESTILGLEMVTVPELAVTVQNRRLWFLFETSGFLVVFYSSEPPVSGCSGMVSVLEFWNLNRTTVPKVTVLVPFSLTVPVWNRNRQLRFRG